VGTCSQKNNRRKENKRTTGSKFLFHADGSYALNKFIQLKQDLHSLANIGKKIEANN
jgi:hypothetical protein